MDANWSGGAWASQPQSGDPAPLSTVRDQFEHTFSSAGTKTVYVLGSYPTANGWEFEEEPSLLLN